jgi:hypothetical protein
MSKAKGRAAKAPIQLTLEQKKKLLLTPCKTRAELKNWVKFFFFGAGSTRCNCIPSRNY